MQKMKPLVKVKEKVKDKDKPIPPEKLENVDILQTWGTGSLRRTMTLNIKKRLYSQIGWKIGDFLKVEVELGNNRLIISKVDVASSSDSEQAEGIKKNAA